MDDVERETQKRVVVGGEEIEFQVPLPVECYDASLSDLLQSEPFFASVSLQIEKLITDDPRVTRTAAVTWSDGDFALILNVDFIEMLLSKGARHHIQSVLAHEFVHITNDHLTTRRLARTSSRDDMDFENIVQDLADNSILVHGMKRRLPSHPWVPGLRPGKAQDPTMFEDAGPPVVLDPAVERFYDLVEKAPALGSAEEYHDLLVAAWDAMRKRGGDGDIPGSGIPDESADAGNTPGAGVPGNGLLGDLMDSHDLWGGQDPNDEDRAGMMMRARDIIKKAVEDCAVKGWGNIPSRMKAQLLARLEPTVDWRQELDEWTGLQTCRIEHSSTFRKINKRFPMEYPGKRRNRGLRLAIAIDMSGSMSDGMVAEVLGEAFGMAEVASVTIIPFDATVDEPNVRSWDAGDPVVIPRSTTGGTSFDAPTKWVNSFAQRDSFDALMMLTDGACGRPSECVIPRVWVICKGHKLYFQTSEKVIQLT